MQAKKHMTKLIKFSSKLPLSITLAKKFWDASGQTDVGNEEIDLRIKNLLSYAESLEQQTN